VPQQYHQQQQQPQHTVTSGNKSWHMEDSEMLQDQQHTMMMMPAANNSPESKMVVPKLTLKIPKIAFQNQNNYNNIDSDQDSGDEEDDEENSSSDEDNENYDTTKSDQTTSGHQNLSNSNNNNEFSSSLSDSENNDDRRRMDENVEETPKRPENMPSLKLKIKNLTSNNPESVLENYDFHSLSTTTTTTSTFKLTTTDNDHNESQLNDVDMTECPMDLEPSLSSSCNISNNGCNSNSENISNSNHDESASLNVSMAEPEKEPEPKKIIIDGNLITPANEDVLTMEVRFNEGLNTIPIVTLMKICLRVTIPYCLYCNHARKIVVNGKGLALHFITHHRFHAHVESITGEELHPEKIVDKLEESMSELENCYFNLETFDDHDEVMREGHVTVVHEKLYECFQCRFQTPIHKELYLHNRKMHQKSLINCLMCKTGFYSYSELLCHICPGVPNKQEYNDYKFHCCLCNLNNIPSAFRLMVHLRKQHFACDVCLEKCCDQGKLSSHVWKHKLLHICFRCHIYYQSKADIMKHLFWKHGTEGVECTKCLQKKWPHVYHFCVPPASFTCPHCEMQFTRAMSLKIHLRLHEDGAKYVCSEIGCEKKFVSKKLLVRHLDRHETESNALERKNNNDDQEHTENTVIIPKEIDEGFCTRTLPVVFKRFIKKPTTNARKGDKNSTEHKSDAKSSEVPPAESTGGKKENKEAKPTLPDLPETKLNLSESSDTDSSDSEDEKDSKSKHTATKSATSAASADTKTHKTLDKNAKQLSEQKSIKQTKTDQDDDGGNKALLQMNKITSLSDSDDDDDDNGANKVKENTKSKTDEPMKNIMENLKTFQDAQSDTIAKPSSMDQEIEKPSDNLHENENNKCEDQKVAMKKDDQNQKPQTDDIPDKMPDHLKLHVCFSDHDYAKMFSPPRGSTKDDVEDMIQSAKINKDDKKSQDKNSNDKGKKVQKEKKKNFDFSSSSSSGSSSSDSSSGSSSGSSSSSSGSSTDSSSSEASSNDANSNRPRNKKYTKKRSKKDTKKVDEEEPEEIPRDPDDIIYESDLQTEESDTDEEFYDEHPLRNSNKLEVSTDKPKKLGIIDGIVENSRPSTPSLPPDEKVEKRMKVKKRKRDHKKVPSPAKRLHRENSLAGKLIDNDDEDSTLYNRTFNNRQQVPETPQNMNHNKSLMFANKNMHTSTPVSTIARPQIEWHQENQIRQLLQSTQQQPVLPILQEQQHMQQQHSQHNYNHQTQPQQQFTPNNINNEYINVSRVSSAQSSRMNSDNEQSGVKRSQRRRIPNKFYGYTSDDESMASQLLNNTGIDGFKPIPPPQLTWRKEDLPSKSGAKSPLPQQMQSQMQRVPPLRLNVSQTNDLSLNIPQHMHSFASENVPAPPQIYENYDLSMQHVNKQQLPINNLSILNESAPAISNNQIRKRSYTPSTDEDRQLQISEPKRRQKQSQNMYAFHTLETPPTVPVSQPPIPRLKLTIGSNNKIRRRNINPLKPPAAKKRKVAAPKASTSLLKKSINNSLKINNNPYAKQLDAPSDEKPTSALEKQQKLEEAIQNTQQYFQRYNHTQVSSAEIPQDTESDGRVYCYCRRAYDELQGMIGCDGPSCQIEWFHFECVGILVPPKGSWYCPECQKQQQQTY
jgi:hypothetical protein